MKDFTGEMLDMADELSDVLEKKGLPIRLEDLIGSNVYVFANVHKTKTNILFASTVKSVSYGGGGGHKVLVLNLKEVQTAIDGNLCLDFKLNAVWTGDIDTSWSADCTATPRAQKFQLADIQVVVRPKD